MCITSKHAKLEATNILSFKKPNGNIFLSYSNRVTNQINGRNCMILPIPGMLKSEWFYDTTPYNSFMTYIGSRTHVSNDLNWGIFFKGMTLSVSRGLASSKTQVGMYEVHFSNVMKDLALLNNELNLEISQELLDFFLSHYAKFSFICCLFDGEKEMWAQPIALEYTPINPNILFYPSMDAHDGKKPNRHFVEVDHTIIAPVKYKKVDFKNLWSVPDFLNDLEWGAYKLDSEYANGDIYCDLTQDMQYANLKRSYETII